MDEKVKADLKAIKQSAQAIVDRISGEEPVSWENVADHVQVMVRLLAEHEFWMEDDGEEYCSHGGPPYDSATATGMYDRDF